VFGLIKLFGYYFVAAWIGRRYRPPSVAKPLIVALSRIALGALFAWLIWSAVGVKESLPTYMGLVLLRAVEWALIIWFFHERPLGRLDGGRLAKLACFGTLGSCVLDLPAAFGAFVIPALAYGIC